MFFSPFISLINGGIADQNGSTVAATGVEDRIVLEDETTRGDPYEGKAIVQEKFTEHHYEHVECPGKFTI